MKIVENIVSTFVRRMTLCFTLIVLTFTVVGSFTNMESFGKGLAISQLVSFFLFSVLVAVSFGIADFIKNSSIIRRTVQFVLTYASVVLVFFTSSLFKSYLSGMQNPAFSILVVTFCFVLIYTCIAVLVLAASFVRNKIINSSKEYVNMFDEQKK